MQSVLEQRFPHIAARLTEVWLDGCQASNYLDALLFKESARAERHGFTNDLWLELTFLNDLLRLEYPPQSSPHAIDIWAEAADVPAATS
jgi:hypothetical protein